MLFDAMTFLISEKLGCWNWGFSKKPVTAKATKALRKVRKEHNFNILSLRT
jgi:hypothetical protein